MNDLSSTLFKVLVREFYRVNAGFFLIVIGICFGFLRDVEHIALAHYFTSREVLMLIPFLVWLIYSIKIITFNSLALRKKENEFLLSVAALEARKLWAQIALVVSWQFIPVFAYGAFLMAVSLQSNQTVIPFLIFLLLLLPWTWMTVSLYRKIRKPDPGIIIGYWRRKVNSIFIRSYILYYPEWIASRQPLLAIGTKVLACTMIIAISRLYLFDTYDERLFAMGCALTFSFNLVLVFHYHRFENFHFSLMRSLPLSYSQRMLYFMLTWTVLMLPETGAIFNYFPAALSSFQIIPVLAFGLSTGILSYGLLFTRDIDLEGFIQYVFWICFAWIVLILFKLPVIALAIIHICVGMIAFKRNFYRFEFNGALGSDK